MKKALYDNETIARARDRGCWVAHWGGFRFHSNVDANQRADHKLVALEDFNLHNLINFNREPNTDLISLVDDVLLPFGGPVGTPDNGLRNDPVTGETVSKAELFRRILRGQVPSAHVKNEGGFLVVRLNTFSLPRKLSTFFIGPRYDSAGNLTPDSGKYLDKIEWLKFNLIVTNPPGPTTRLIAGFVYGGTCCIRVASFPSCFLGTL